MNKTKVFFVLGDNGKGNSGAGIFGMYPTEEMAFNRLKFLEKAWDEGENGCEYMWIDELEVGPDGADCDIEVCG